MPRWTPTADQLRQIEAMSGYGLPERDIATLMKVSEPTLRKHARQALDDGIAKANSQTAQTLHRLANGAPVEYDEHGRIRREELKPDKGAAIFLAKVRLGMKETVKVEHGGPDGDKTINIRLLPAEAGVRVSPKAGRGARPPK